MKGHLLPDWIALAVEIELLHLRQAGGPSDDGLARVRGAFDALREMDGVDAFANFFFGGKGCVQVAARLAECLAIMSYVPGGVTAFGHHWESQP